jgi:hypothetical protein
VLPQPVQQPETRGGAVEPPRRQRRYASGCDCAFLQGNHWLEAAPAWKQLTPEQRYAILDKHGVRVLPTITVGTTDEVLDTLRHTKLSELRAIGDALPTRFGNAAAAAKLLEPKAQHVSLPGGTIRNEDELQSWLTAAGDKIREKLKEGPVIV